MTALQNRDLVKCTPIATTYCGLCDNVIYRDTLDKDPAYKVYETGRNARGILRSIIVCSISCSRQLLGSDDLFQATLEKLYLKWGKD